MNLIDRYRDKNDKYLFNNNMEHQLDWAHPDLLYTLFVDYVNGFGFQCDEKQNDKPHIYLALMAHGRDRFDEFSGNDEQVCLLSIQSELRGIIAGFDNSDVWMTDWLGRTFITVYTGLYHYIPEILNVVLKCGYKFVTQTRPKVLFRPGEVFSRRTFELNMIAQLREQAEQLRGFPRRSFGHFGNPESEAWKHLYEFNTMRSCTWHWNWATDEGKLFCSELRSQLCKKKLRSAVVPRMTWDRYRDTCNRYGILHVAGWGAYEPDGIPKEPIIQSVPPPQEAEPPQVPPPQVPPLQVPPPQDVLPLQVLPTEVPPPQVLSEVEECMICLEAPVSTVVMPCGHMVVCDECSIGLRNTPDNKICCHCRCPITHVFYDQDNRVEEK